MLSDDEPRRGFRWGRAIVGAILGFVLAFMFVKVGESRWWWLLVPAAVAAFGTGFELPWWAYGWGSSGDSSDSGSSGNDST
jgi:hypothetical protein